VTEFKTEKLEEMEVEPAGENDNKDHSVLVRMVCLGFDI